MKISSKKEFHSFVNTLSSLLLDAGVSIKSSRAQELLAYALAGKSANGLYSMLPKKFNLTDDSFTRFDEHFSKKKFATDDTSKSFTLLTLDKEHRSCSSFWGNDSNCYPTKLSNSENYWYLTNEGWLPWKEMDFEEMKVELNIYKVVHSSFRPFLDETTYTGITKALWTASS